MKIDKIKLKKGILIAGLFILIIIGIPVIIDCLMCYTDFLYCNFGWTLSPNGLQNKEWLEFWCNYLLGIIALFSAYLVWISGKKERERQKNVEKGHFYENNLKQEQRVLVNICKAIDTSVLYKIVNQMNIENLQEQKQMIQEARDNIFTAQTEFELLTDIPMSFNNCLDKQCVFWNIVKSVSEIFYKIENSYIKILNAADEYISKIEMQINYNKQISNYESIISEERLEVERYQIRIKMTNLNKDEYEIYTHRIFHLNEEINKNLSAVQSLRKQLKSLDEIKNEFIIKTKDLQDYIVNEKPNLICRGKEYIEYKKNKYDEILKNGSANFREVLQETKAE